MSKLVTVVTSTWNRHKTLFELCLPSVARQTYPEVEHIIVMDGNDAELTAKLLDAGYGWNDPRKRITRLGRNWSTFSGDGGFGATCRMVGGWLAAGDYIAWLDDDNIWEPEHLQVLVNLVEENNVEFATTSWWYGEKGGRKGGESPPGYCRSDTSALLCRAEVLKKGGSWQLDGYCGDGLMVDRWMNAGCTWAHNDRPTYTVPVSRHGSPD